MKDVAATIRDNTVASLLRYNTIAQDRVEVERIDPTPSGDMPRLVVYADHDATITSQAGTAPTFTVTINLVVQALVEAAQKPDAVRLMDTIIAEVKDALLCDPLWTVQAMRVTGYRVVTSMKGQSASIVGDARILITANWFETYNPRIGPRLATVNVTETPLGVPSPIPVTAEIDLPPPPSD